MKSARERMDMNAAYDLEVKRHCPNAEVVYDLFHRKPVAADATAFEAHLPPKSTALYYTGSEAGLAPLLAMY